MNREIKFRAWDTELKRYFFFTLKEIYAQGMIDRYDLPSYGGQIGFQQFTGLHDKSGKEIYEGDIVVYKDVSGSGEERNFGNSDVRWNDEFCSFNVSDPIDGATIEVIGNIYENKDLLI